MFKVINPFYDAYSDKYFDVDTFFESLNPERIRRLINAGYLDESPVEPPKTKQAKEPQKAA